MIPVFIIAFNNPTYVSSMIDQLLKYTSDIYVIDNCSTFPPMIKLLDETKVNVIRMPQNYGHMVYLRPEIQDLVKGDCYCITDPDLRLNQNLPSNFIEIFKNISDDYQMYKVGFALDRLNNIRTDVTFKGKSITDWEAFVWNCRVDHPKIEMYYAEIDTTFCLINKKYKDDNLCNHIRVAGDFLCIHRPWLVTWKDELPEDELSFYRTHSKCSSWV